MPKIKAEKNRDYWRVNKKHGNKIKIITKCPTELVRKYNTRQKMSSLIQNENNSIMNYVPSVPNTYPNMQYKQKKIDDNSYCTLLRKTEDKLCDFCEKTFNSRYSLIVHNADHIVIPLLKQEYHQCKKCLFHFQSHTDLVHHLEIKHNVVNNIAQVSNQNTSQIESVPALNRELKANINLVSEIVDLTDDDDEPICSYISSSSQLNKLNYLESSENRPNFLNPNYIKELRVIKLKCDNMQTNIEKIIYNDNNQKSVYSGIYNNIEKNKGNEEIISNPWSVAIDKHVSVYENHNETTLGRNTEEYILPDVFYDVKITPNIQVNQTNLVPLLNLMPCLINEGPNYENKKAVLVGNANYVDKSKQSQKVVDYSELTLQNNYSCKYCHITNTFPNRYTLILHETSHLSIINHKPNICILCNTYFKPEDYENHMKCKHPYIKVEPNKLKDCLICGFKHHNYKKHLKIYHFDMFLWEDKRMEYKKQQITYGNIIIKCINAISNSYSDIIFLCKCCMENEKKDLKYIYIANFKKTGSRLKCHECGRSVITIHLLERNRYRFMYEDDVKKKTKKSNEMRLKNIQMRLKMINKLRF